MNMHMQKKWFVVFLFLVLCPKFEMVESPCIGDSPQVIVLTPKAQYGTPPQGYTEEDFTLIEINAEHITILSEVVVSDTMKRLDCFTNISYPATGSLWHFRLPSTYPDASTYRIQRSSVEIYYCFHDNQNEDRYTGVDTYWNIPANELTSDFLQFTILAPIITNTFDRVNSNDTNIEYILVMPRTINTLRTYYNVQYSAEYEIPKAFDQQVFEAKLIDETGGEAFYLDITNSSHLKLTLVAGTASTGDTVRVEFDMGTILSSTDYQYRLIFYTAEKEDSFFSGENVFMNIIVPILAAFLFSLGAYAQIWGWINERRGKGRIIKQSVQNYLRYGVLTALMFLPITFGVMYLFWRF